MAKIRKKTRANKTEPKSPFSSYWTNTNYLLLYIGIGILLLGFYLMSFGPWDNPVSLHVSPVVLLIAYLVVLPAAILFNKKNKLEESDDVSQG